MNQVLWKPKEERILRSNMLRFQRYIEYKYKLSFASYQEFHQFSVEDVARFWQEYVLYAGLVFKRQATEILADPKMPGAKWFAGAQLNYTENIFKKGFSGTAISFVGENGNKKYTPINLSYPELEVKVIKCMKSLTQEGVKKGDVVGSFMANIPEAAILALACAGIGAVFTSASPDFGLRSLVSRFSQVNPVIVFAVTHYYYSGKKLNTEAVVQGLKQEVSSIKKVISVGYPGEEQAWQGDQKWEDFLKIKAPPAPYASLDFDHPLYIMYSSGTTGAPKCIVHGVGGTMLQHHKELSLHSNIGVGDKLLYFTTMGWMMWNWQLSGLLTGATLYLYDGNPGYPDLSAIWQIADDFNITHFGTSGKYIEACMKESQLNMKNRFAFTSLQAVIYTGSPLSGLGYRWVYDNIKADVHLAGISGGTDILSCFALGNPTLPVTEGRMQCIGLGVDMVAFNEEAKPVYDEQGELVCRQALPCMPIYFKNDPDFVRYKEAYFDTFPGLWRHGDLITIFKTGEVMVHGRSDATLNPGGVRIGSAEIYTAMDNLPEIKNSIAVGWVPPQQSDESIMLFVVLNDDLKLNEEITKKIKNTIRTICSPRHVPAFVFQVSGIPMTRSGKIVELTVKAILAGKAISNRDALSNPEVLIEYENIREKLNCQN